MIVPRVTSVIVLVSGFLAKWGTGSQRTFIISPQANRPSLDI